MTAATPLRILTVANVPPDPNSGAAGTVYHTNIALRELGHDVDAIWADQLGPRRIAHGNLHSLLEQPRRYRREVLKAVTRKRYDVVMMSQPQAYLAAKALKNVNFQGVVINRSHGLELRVDAVLPEWHRRLKVSESTFPRSLLTPVMRRFLHRQWTNTMRFVDGVVVPCEMDRLFLKARYPASTVPIRTIHHGVSSQLLNCQMRTSTPERSKRILHVGQFSFFKGPHLVAQIMNQVCANQADVTMTWVTSEEGCSRANSLIDKPFRDRITFIPWTTQEKLASIYDSHGVFLFPTLCEGAAKSALEAMARGLCVVASDDSGTRDYIKSGITGWLCPVGDADAFCDAIRKASTSVCRQVSQLARDYATSKSWEACAQQLSSFYYDLLPSRKRR